MPVFMRSVSPGMCNPTSERSIFSLPTAICHRVGALVVSSGTVSLNATSMCASAIEALSTLTVSLAIFMPRLRNSSLPTLPFTRADGTNWAVFRRTSLKSSLSTTTLLFSNGISRTLTVSSLASTMVSVTLYSESLGCVARNPYTARSRGKRNLTRSMPTVIRVDDDT